MSSLDQQLPHRTGPSAGDLEERLRAEVAAHEATRRELETLRRDAQVRMFERTRERDVARARFETALHGTRIYVFTQDLELRYTFVSKPLFGLAAEDMLGQIDDNVIPSANRAAIIAVKCDVLATGQPRDAEFRVESGGRINWYDFHLEALRDSEGAIVGLTGAVVDITERKENEAHLRLLMRELTHRSKNLLAVIQAMARQTAKHTRNVERFLAQFGARLQALARSHDLLVQEGWHGASLDNLVRTQLGHYLDRKNSPVTIEGEEEVQFKPEAAQSLGLALHELATNAAKYGALSRVRGRVHVVWKRLADQGGAIELQWIESRGPKVAAPKRRGFGSMVIEHNLARAIEAKVDLAFDPDGLKCRIVIPAAHVLAEREVPER